MSLISTWGSGGDDEVNLSVETSDGNLRNLDDEKIKKLFFQAIRSGEVLAVKNILQFSRTLLNEQLFGFEGAYIYSAYSFQLLVKCSIHCAGADVYNINLNSKSKRCYTYTGIKKDGFFYPIHISAESGNKLLTHMLAKAGADISVLDYRGIHTSTPRYLDGFLTYYVYVFNKVILPKILQMAWLHMHFSSSVACRSRLTNATRVRRIGAVRGRGRVNYISKLRVLRAKSS